jgi:hypothetical protein
VGKRARFVCGFVLLDCGLNSIGFWGGALHEEQLVDGSAAALALHALSLSVVLLSSGLRRPLVGPAQSGVPASRSIPGGRLSTEMPVP